ncbi:sensor histidine kinase [Pseudoduganella namucuonensis]|uniref:Signal transduction histidine kinase n=1 Tax=Pseudoduganella namucuonensis TaxID=1035707 RepID=A0A1I7I8S2_9BURK|nr:CHASE domain-containing protein [Pseudoduganella namucuonensis]SFU69375.1 Signal transduction histidine kinase [Pseudoduganella namucuonensis]
MRTLFAQKKLFSPTKPLWWTGLLLSLGVGVLLYGATLKSLETEAGERFRNQARSSQFNIATGIKAYTDVLRGTASFFHSVDTVSRDNFHRYVQGMDLPRSFPAIISINFAQHVPAGQSAVFEQHVRTGPSHGGDDYPDLLIKPPVLQRDAAIISLIEPGAGLKERVGMDIAARPAVAESLARSRDTGGLSASGQPIGFDSSAMRPALAMRLPVYRQNVPLDTVEERRAAYLGSVGIGFSVYRLVLEALEEMPVRNARLTLHDIGEHSDPATLASATGGTLLFDSAELDKASPSDDDMFSYTLPIDFNGRTWRAHFTAPTRSLYSRFDAFLPWLALLTGFAGSMLIYALFHALSSSRLRAIRMAKAMTKELRESQAKLQLSHHKLRRLAAHAEQIKEEERKRIAREIHDDLGQNLLALRIEADLLTTRTSHRHPRLHERARCTLAQIDYTIKSVRQIINDLRPNVLDLGLGAAVEWQIAQFRQRSGIVCELIESGGEIAIGDTCAIAYFRILQESLSNVLQHAHASLVRVELRQQDGVLSMIISDNGVGLHARSRNKFGSFGLVGIEERISILGGECSITGSPHSGTTIHVSVPLEQAAAAYPHLEAV